MRRLILSSPIKTRDGLVLPLLLVLIAWIVRVVLRVRCDLSIRIAVGESGVDRHSDFVVRLALCSIIFVKLLRYGCTIRE